MEMEGFFEHSVITVLQLTEEGLECKLKLETVHLKNFTKSQIIILNISADEVPGSGQRHEHYDRVRDGQCDRQRDRQCERYLMDNVIDCAIERDGQCDEQRV